jgi:hypothetical protein
MAKKVKFIKLQEKRAQLKTAKRKKEEKGDKKSSSKKTNN